MWINKYGLLNPKTEDVVSENCPLTSQQYNLLGGDLGVELDRYIENCYTGTVGLYNQMPEFHGNKDDYMSPDQLIAFVSRLYVVGRIDEIWTIWNYLLWHLGSYDNLTGRINFERLMQLKAFVFVGLCCNSWLAWLLKFPLLISMVLSCRKPGEITSGKLKSWVIMKTLNMTWSFKICSKLVGNWRDAFFTFYYQDNHPIRVIFKN